MISAAARVLHAELCDDEPCGRWAAGSDPSSPYYRHHYRHVLYYTRLAMLALEAAGKLTENRGGPKASPNTPTV